MKRSNGNIILALDISTTKTGYAIYDGEKCIKSGSIKPKGEWLERAFKMKEEIEKLLEYKIEKVVLEDTYSKANISTLKKLCITQGILLGMFKCEIVFIVPKKWQSFYKFGNIKRDELKKLSIAEALKHSNINPKDDDEADAVNIGYYIAKGGVK